MLILEFKDNVKLKVKELDLEKEYTEELKKGLNPSIIKVDSKSKLIYDIDTNDSLKQTFEKIVPGVLYEYILNEEGFYIIFKKTRNYDTDQESDFNEKCIIDSNFMYVLTENKLQFILNK